MALVFVIVCGLQIYFTYLTWVRKGEAVSRLETAQNTQQTIAQSQTLSSDQRDRFTRVLLSVIPASEDAFNLGDAVVNLMTRTNMHIDTFSPPNPSDIAGMNNTVSVLISGTAEDLDRFLSTYKYAGGRFVTMDSCTLKYEGALASADIKMTFHTTPIPKGTDQLTSFTTELRKKLVSIQDQLPGDTMLVTPSDANAVIDTNYDVRAPF